VDGDQRRHAEAALVLFAHLGAGALGGDHHHREVFTDVLTLFHDVEAVAVGEAGALLHQRHDLRHHVGVLLVGREVTDQVGARDELLVRAHFEAVAGGVAEARALLLDGIGTQRVAHVQAGVAHVEALVQALGAAADDDHLLALEPLDAVELATVHEATATELVQLLRHREGVEVVLSGHGLSLQVRTRPSMEAPAWTQE
jgi:hypothetical protein